MPSGDDRTGRLLKALPVVTASFGPQQAFKEDSGQTWNVLRYGLQDLKQVPHQLETVVLPERTDGLPVERSIDDVWEFVLDLMLTKPKHARQTMDAVAMLLSSQRWADGLIRAKGIHRLSLWKFSALAGAEPSPVDLASAILKLGVSVDELLPLAALESGTGFVGDLAARLTADEREALEASELGSAWRQSKGSRASGKRSSLLGRQVSADDFGTLSQANKAEAASIEAAGKKDRKPGCRKDVVDHLLDLTDEALDIAAKRLEPMMSGYAGEMNLAVGAKAKVREFRQRQANLQAQLVIIGPCQVGKTSLTYSLVGFAALPPTIPSMVTTRWVHTPNLAVPRLTMPESLSSLLESWAQRLETSFTLHDGAVEGIDAVAKALAQVHGVVHNGRTTGLINSRELDAISRPSMCVSIEVAFSALASLEESLTECGSLSILDLPSPDGDVLWELQDVQLLSKRALQEADGVLVVVDASKHEVPRWMGRLLHEAFVQDRVLRNGDAWIVANRIDQMPEFFCKDGVTDACQRVKACQLRDFHDVILGEDRVIPTAARLSLLAMYGNRQVTSELTQAVLSSLDREPWFVQTCSFLFGVHWSDKVKDMDRTKWRKSMKELHLLGQVTDHLANSVLKTAYVQMLPRSVARVMFDLSQLISSFVSSLRALEGTSSTIDAEQIRLLFKTYSEDVQKRMNTCLSQNAPSEADLKQLAASKCSAPVVFDGRDSTELNEKYFSILAREAMSLWQPYFVRGITACCEEVMKAHQKWLRSLDVYLGKGGADAVTKQKLLLDSKNLQLLATTGEGFLPLQNSERDRLVQDHAGKVSVTVAKQLFQWTRRTYHIKPENASAFLLDLLETCMSSYVAEIQRRCMLPVQQNFQELESSIEELNRHRLAGVQRRKDSRSFDFSFAHRLAEVLPRVANFNGSREEESSSEVLAEAEAESCEKLCYEVRTVLQEIEQGSR